MIKLPKKCLRGYKKYSPLSQIQTVDGMGICCGLIPKDEIHNGDFICHCFICPTADSQENYDMRDVIDEASVLVQTVSILTNIETSGFNIDDYRD